MNVCSGVCPPPPVVMLSLIFKAILHRKSNNCPCLQFHVTFQLFDKCIFYNGCQWENWSFLGICLCCNNTSGHCKKSEARPSGAAVSRSTVHSCSRCIVHNMSPKQVPHGVIYPISNLSIGLFT